MPFSKWFITCYYCSSRLSCLCVPFERSEKGMKLKMVDSNKLLSEIIDNILDYAGNLEEIEQYNFLCDMFPIVPEIDIRKVYYSNDEFIR